jgi:hypothetical protein
MNKQMNEPIMMKRWGKNAMLHVRSVAKYLYELQTISIQTKWKTHTYKLETSKLVKQKHLRKI